MLSGAHCFKYNIKQIVRLGEYDILTNTDGQHIDIPVDHVQVHENYNSNITEINDIAIVYLARDVKFTGELKFDFYYS